jgi:hypothetical protein
MSNSIPAIKPIETRWNGYRFRSRLEARWAVFFERLGLRWEYEPEGFVLPSGRYYLPDFKIHGIGWFEIKPIIEVDLLLDPWPNEGSLEEEFFLGFTGKKEPEIYCGQPGGVLYGPPGPVGDYLDTPGSYAGCIGADNHYYFCECPDCGVIGFEFHGRSARVKHDPDCPVPKSGSDKNYNIDSPRILLAATAARSARFEHGEQP